MLEGATDLNYADYPADFSIRSQKMRDVYCLSLSYSGNLLFEKNTPSTYQGPHSGQMSAHA